MPWLKGQTQRHRVPHDGFRTWSRRASWIRLRPREIAEVEEQFSVAVTPEMLELIPPGDPVDPIFLQFVPTASELQIQPEELPDPIGDDPYSPIKGITHRYPDRVLLKPVHICPVYCRFCLRREQVGPGSEVLSPDEMEQALDYIRSHPEIWEVILTGGDPMVLSARRLHEIIRTLDAIRHVEIIRLHTRVPVVDPRKITHELVTALKTATPVYVVLHTNHAREMTPAAAAACARLVDAGIPMLSQTVLLKGVNDDRKSMEDLLRTLARQPSQTLLPPPWRPGSRHQSLADHDRNRPTFDARAARARLGALPTDLRARHTRRPRQSSCRASGSRRRRRSRLRRPGLPG